MGRFRKRVREPLLEMLRQGLSPEGLAWSLAVGLGLGISPLFGTSTALCVGVGRAFRLNHPALQLANYLVYPLQLLLLLPFIRLGELIFGPPPLPFSLSILQGAMKVDPWGAIHLFWSSLWHAAVAWLLLAPLPVALLAWGLTPLFRRALKAFQRSGSLDSLS